ncbi:MAG: hypothetical protein JWP44_5026 [Mucilaginibacter sp.]|nr:hypothetical protein [Mucilaginibacter sp.]
MYYTGYLLTQASRKQILEAFPPSYKNVVAHHITERHNVPSDTLVPEIPNSAQVVGYVNSGDGIEALLVSINGETVRPDGKSFYHITLSLSDGRKHLESNNYIQNATSVDPVNIMVIPKLFAGSPKATID